MQQYRMAWAIVQSCNRAHRSFLQAVVGTVCEPLARTIGCKSDDQLRSHRH
eukprot:jgi/Botrbrau1/18388/Bobra.0681s0003.1